MHSGGLVGWEQAPSPDPEQSPTEDHNRTALQLAHLQGEENARLVNVTFN